MTGWLPGWPGWRWWFGLGLKLLGVAMVAQDPGSWGPWSVSGCATFLLGTGYWLVGHVQWFKVQG